MSSAATERGSTVQRSPFPRVLRPVVEACCWLVATAAWAPSVVAADYLGPSDLTVTPDGRRLFVACRDAQQVLELDTGSGRVVRRLRFSAPPTGLALSPSGQLLVVTCAGPVSELAVVRLDRWRVERRIRVGHTALSPVFSPDGRLFVCNRFDNDVSVVDVRAGRQVRRVRVVREPVAAAVTPDGRKLFVANHLPNQRSNVTLTEEVCPVVSVVDLKTFRVSAIRLPNGSHSLRGLTFSPDGRWVFVTHLEGNFQELPFRVDMGWINTNVVSVIDVEAEQVVATIGLDEMDRGAGNPWGVACSPDGRFVCVAVSGTHELAVIELEQLVGDEARRTMQPMMGVWPIYLSLGSTLWRRVPLPGRGPRAVTVGRGTAFVAEYFSDSVAVVDLQAVWHAAASAPRWQSEADGAGGRADVRPGRSTASSTRVVAASNDEAERRSTHPARRLAPVRRWPLGPSPTLSPARRGELLFNDATLCFQHWQSCASCHPDGRSDALNWDLLNDGAGNPKNTKSLLLAHRTPPAMATGVRPSAEAAVRAGLIHILFSERPERDAAAIDAYLRSLKPVPSPRLVAGRLSPAAERGKRLFFSPRVGCFRCHPPPLYTDLRQHRLGTPSRVDQNQAFDTPTLIEVWRTAPYWHDGRYATVEELLRVGRHGLPRGPRELSEQQVRDLAEFVESL